MSALKPWPSRAGCIGPDSLAVWNRLSVLQVETIHEAGAEGMPPADIAITVDADVDDVIGCLQRAGLYGEPF